MTLLQSFQSDDCLLCMESGEMVDHIFLHLPIEFMAQVVQFGSFGLIFS